MARTISGSGLVELASGHKMPLDIIKGDGYGAIEITVTVPNGKAITILAEESA